jgi:hypothetical protein
LLRSALAAAVVATVAVAPLSAQGKGKGKGGGGAGGDDHPNRGGHVEHTARPRGPGNDQARVNPGNRPTERAADKDVRREARSDARIERRVEREFAGDVDLDRGKGRGKLTRRVSVDELSPALRRYYVADKITTRAAVGAVARARMRGADAAAFVIAPLTDRVLIRNRTGDVLVDMDERRVRELGRWDVDPLDDETSEGSPSFCRSGAGHPVWGRQWCLDKGFGLSGESGYRWGRTTGVQDIVFRRVSPTGSLVGDALVGSPTGSLVGDALVGLLGQRALDRLALHAITLGLSDPISGRWMGESTGPRVLLLSSGTRPVAEVVDLDNDARADLMLVALKDY